MGPLGFEPRTDGLKVSGSSLRTAPKQPQNSVKSQENAGKQLKTAGKRQVSGHLPDTKYDKYDACEGLETQVSGQKGTYVRMLSSLVSRGAAWPRPWPDTWPDAAGDPSAVQFRFELKERGISALNPGTS